MKFYYKYEGAWRERAKSRGWDQRTSLLGRHVTMEPRGLSAKAVAANEVWHSDAMTTGGACRDVSGREIHHDYQSGAGSTIMDWPQGVTSVRVWVPNWNAKAVNLGWTAPPWRLASRGNERTSGDEAGKMTDPSSVFPVSFLIIDKHKLQIINFMIKQDIWKVHSTVKERTVRIKTSALLLIHHNKKKNHKHNQRPFYPHYRLSNILESLYAMSAKQEVYKNRDS